MKPKLAVSTSWNYREHIRARDILDEITKLGLRRLELNFNLPQRLADEFAHLQQRGECEIVSLHNYCPIPDDADPRRFSPDDPCLSSLDEHERRRAVEQTKHTIDFARHVGAKAVVVHLGKVGIKDTTVKLSRIDTHSPRFREMKDAMIRERAAAAEPYFSQTVKSLEKLEPYARHHGVCLGVETRYYYREIPSLDELAYLFKHFGTSNIYYWHDVGHAQVGENLGFLRQEDYLKRYSERLIGIHLHDIIGISDHRAPGGGAFDFTRLLSYLAEDVLLVIEAHQPVTIQEMAAGIAALERL
jgi:sugar phosphate isomerase/epimerase